MEWARAGESALVVGVNGVGKSNLFNHLQDPVVKRHYLGDAAVEHIFVRVDLRELPEITDRGVYSLILEQLELLEDREESLDLEPRIFSELGGYHEALLDAGDDALKVRRFFRRTIQTVMQRPKLHLILLFDQFDNVYQDVNPQLFANLRGLRESYKYRLSYFVFSRRLFPIMEETNRQRAEFLELLSANVLGLKPYNHEDSAILLKRIASRIQHPLDAVSAERLIKLSAGHAGLLKSVFLALSQSGMELESNDQEASKQLLAQTNVQGECWNIWQSISTEEQRLLYRITRQTQSPTLDEHLHRQLRLKGLIKGDEQVTVFSPLFREYVSRQDALWEKPIHLDKSTRSVWIQGEKKAELTKIEYGIFSLLYNRIGHVVDKEELIAAGWPEAEIPATDQMLNTNIYRIRQKIEPDPKNYRFLVGVTNHGYRLDEHRS